MGWGLEAKGHGSSVGRSRVSGFVGAGFVGGSWVHGGSSGVGFLSLIVRWV